MVEKRPHHRLIAQQRLALADGARLTKALCAGVQVGLKGRPQVLHPAGRSATVTLGRMTHPVTAAWHLAK